MKASRYAGFWLAVLAAFGFSVKVTLIKLAYAPYPVAAVTLLALRMAFALPAFAWVGLQYITAGLERLILFT